MLAIFLDIESTGLDPYQNHAVEIALKIIDLSSNTLKGSYSAVIKISKQAWEERDPQSILINGFSWEELHKGKNLKEVRQDIIELFEATGVKRGKAVFICQNPSFDRAFFMQMIDQYQQEQLNWPYHWLDLASMFWTVFHLRRKQEGGAFPLAMNLSKNEIARFYKLPPEAEPHRAMNGVDHLILCYQAVFQESL